MSALLDVLGRSRHLQKFLKYSSPSSSASIRIQCSPIQLPPAPSIRDDLLVIGLPTELIERLSEVYLQKCREIKSTIEKNWAKFSASLSTLPVHANNNPLNLSSKCAEMYRDRYLRGTQDCAEQILSHARDLRAEELRILDSNSRGSRFQPSSRPLLESSFKKNPFPNRRDKEILARETGMDYRQVYTWFQNRRARARRDGEQVKHKDFCQHSNPSLDNRKAHTLEIFTHSDEGDVESNEHSTTDITPEDEDPRIMEDSILDSPYNETLQGAALRQHPCIFTTPLCALSKERLSSKNPRRRKYSTAFRRQVDSAEITSHITQSLSAIHPETPEETRNREQRSTTFRLESEKFAYHSARCSQQSSSELLGYLTSNRDTPSIQCIRVSSVNATHSFSETFDSHEPSVLEYHSQEISSPTKKRRTMNLESDSSSSLMSLAIVCSEAPVGHRTVRPLPQRTTTSMSAAHFPNIYLLPVDIPTSPPSSESSACASPPSSPLSRTSAYDSDYSDGIFSGSSNSSMSDISTPPLSSTTLPSSHPTFDANRLSSPTLSTSDEDLFGVDPPICARSRVSFDRSTCFPPSSHQVPQIVRKIATCSRGFVSSAAANMLQLDF